MKSITAKNLRRSAWFARAGIIFWLIETIIFIVEHGWHLGAINDAEILCDGIARALMLIAIVFFFNAIYHIVSHFATVDSVSIITSETKESE